MKYYIQVFFICLLFISCNYKGIEVTEIDIPRIKSLKGTKAMVQFDIKVSNPSSHNIYFKQADFDILRNGYTFAKVKINEPIKVPKHTEGSYNIEAQVKLIDVMYVVAGGKRLFDADDLSQFTLNGYVKVGTCLLSKRYVLDNVSFMDVNNIK